MIGDRNYKKKIVVAGDVPVGKVFEVLEDGLPTGRIYKRLADCPVIGNVTALRFPDKLKCQVNPKTRVRVGFAT